MRLGLAEAVPSFRAWEVSSIKCAGRGELSGVGVSTRAARVRSAGIAAKELPDEALNTVIAKRQAEFRVVLA